MCIIFMYFSLEELAVSSKLGVYYFLVIFTQSAGRELQAPRTLFSRDFPSQHRPRCRPRLARCQAAAHDSRTTDVSPGVHRPVYCAASLIVLTLILKVMLVINCIKTCGDCIHVSNEGKKHSTPKHPCR